LLELVNFSSNLAAIPSFAENAKQAKAGGGYCDRDGS
jgi:hypothetical protein